MPPLLKEQLKKVFQFFLENSDDLTSRSDAIKGLVAETKSAITKAENEIKELKNKIIQKFQNNEKFRNEIHQIILNARAEKGKQDPNIQELLNDRIILSNEISNALEECALKFNPNLSHEKYNKQYNSQTIADSFLENPEVYKNYLEAIKKSNYYVFFEEIPILSSLANIKIQVYYDNGHEQQTIQQFNPQKELRGSYPLKPEIWGSKEAAIIWHRGMHFEHAEYSVPKLLLQHRVIDNQNIIAEDGLNNPIQNKVITNNNKVDTTDLIKQDIKESNINENREEDNVSLFSKKLPVDSNLQLSRKNIKQSIEALTANSQLSNSEKLNLESYPNPYILAQFASKVYKDKVNTENDRDYEKRLSLPSGWKLLTTATNTATNNNLGNGYFGAAYWHPELQQVVIAHRGTDPKNLGALWTDAKGIMFNKYVSQMNSAITFTEHIKSVLHEVNKNIGKSFQLSFTGHSLGGWLAQITTFSTKYLQKKEAYFIKSNNILDGYHAHTVVFDSPGCKDMLSVMKNDFDLRYDNSISLGKLDITSYLSAPNRINSCNLHLGTIYRIFTDLSDMGVIDKHTATYNLATHSMDKILQVFDEDTGQVRRGKDGNLQIQEVVDWPVSGILRGAEYKDFFKWAKHFNNYNPALKDDKFKSEQGAVLRYKTKGFDDKSCNSPLGYLLRMN